MGRAGKTCVSAAETFSGASQSSEVGGCVLTVLQCFQNHNSGAERAARQSQTDRERNVTIPM